MSQIIYESYSFVNKSNAVVLAVKYLLQRKRTKMHPTIFVLSTRDAVRINLNGAAICKCQLVGDCSKKFTDSSDKSSGFQTKSFMYFYVFWA